MSTTALSPTDVIALSDRIGELYTFEELGNLTLVCNNEAITGITFQEQPRSDIAQDCLEWARNRGILANFLACVLYARRRDPAYPALLELVKAALPDALSAPHNVQPQVCAVVAGIGSLEALMARDEVRRQVATSRERLTAVGASITLLVIYKSLHDILHRLRTTPIRTLLLAARNAGEDPVCYQTIANHIGETLRAVTDIRAVLAPPDRASLLDDYDRSWIEAMKQFADHSQDGLDNGLPARIRIGLLQIDKILIEQSPQLNRFIFNAANKLPLANLAQALQGVTEVDALFDAQIAPAVTAIGELRQTLLDRVTAHDRLQTVEGDLSILAICLDDEDGGLIIEHMAELWPKTRSAALSTMSLNPGPPTYVFGNKDADRVDASLLGIESAEADPAMAGQTRTKIKDFRTAFSAFQNKVNRFFVEVDSRLKSDFESTAQISGRLRSVIESVP